MFWQSQQCIFINLLLLFESMTLQLTYVNSVYPKGICFKFSWNWHSGSDFSVLLFHFIIMPSFAFTYLWWQTSALTCKINCINVQHNYVNTRLFYVFMQHNYVNMWDTYSTCEIIMLTCDLKYVSCQHNYVVCWNK